MAPTANAAVLAATARPVAASSMGPTDEPTPDCDDHGVSAEDSV